MLSIHSIAASQPMQDSLVDQGFKLTIFPRIDSIDGVTRLVPVMAPDADKSPAAEGGEGNEEAAQPPMQVSATEAPEPVSPVDLPTEQVVFLVRHAESRWNAAQANMSPMGMIWENDHGLSQEGRHQAEELRRKLAEAKEHLPRNAEKAKWLTRLFSPDVVALAHFARISPPPQKWNWGRGVTPGIPYVVPVSLLWGRLDKWNWGPPTPLPLKVGGMLGC